MVNEETENSKRASELVRPVAIAYSRARSEGMKIVFSVQGDGRGHMTQAIAAREMLEAAGHRVVHVLAGSNQSRILPAFFRDAFDCPMTTFAAPGFSIKSGRAISTVGSALHLFRNLGTYKASLRLMEEAIATAAPDLIINFLEPMLGYLNLRRRLAPPTLSVAHHFMFDHPRYPKVPGFAFQKIGMMRYVNLTGANAARLALSFYEAENKPGLFVCPPILRKQLFALTPEHPGRHLLVYLLNYGYADEIKVWSASNPEVPVHCFYDKPGAPAEEQVSPALTFHALHGEKYLRLMASARGVTCTAGFESISEAAYLGKPLLMVPVQNHVEQHVNSLDAQKAGLGTRADSFDLSILLRQTRSEPLAKFKAWVDRAGEVIVSAAEQTARGLTGESRGAGNKGQD
jgi:uncharacterized protein (TIGR00661 family)